MAVMCVYCGNNPGITRDHVPPKNLFPSPKPVNLVTVPCCKQCQTKYKKDEDIFMAWINFGHAGVTKAGKLLWDQKLRRTYEKDLGVKSIITKSFKRVSLKTPGGLCVGKRLAISIDPRRKNNVLKKIVRGLFWVEYKERLLEEVPIEIFGIAGRDKRIYKLKSVTKEATKAWEKIFEYRHRRVPDSFESYWLMSFYRRNYFIAIVDGSKDVA